MSYVKINQTVSDGERKPARGRFYCHDLQLNRMTLELDRDVNVCKAHLHTENEVVRSSHQKVIAQITTTKTLKVKGQGQRSRSNVNNFRPLLAFSMGHIPTKLHRILTSSFRDVLLTDAQTHRQTPPKTIPARSSAVWRAG